METPNLETDANTYRASYAGEGTYNFIMEVVATERGLEIDENVTVPWEWILKVVPPRMVAYLPQRR
jgi:hypothetical protein